MKKKVNIIDHVRFRQLTKCCIHLCFDEQSNQEEEIAELLNILEELSPEIEKGNTSDPGVQPKGWRSSRLKRLSSQQCLFFNDMLTSVGYLTRKLSL